MREVRITRSARKHKLSSGRIREALADAEFIEMRGDVAIYVGTDLRGLEIELGRSSMATEAKAWQ